MPKRKKAQGNTRTSLFGEESVIRKAKYHPQHCVILWLDILGFRDVLLGVERGDQASNLRLTTIEDAFDEKVISEHFPWPYEIQTFGDTFVLIFRFPSNDTIDKAYTLPFRVGDFQCALLRRRVLVRGACETGIWIKGKTIRTGSIYAPLYRAESVSAVTPRIIYGVPEKGEELARLHFNALVSGATFGKAEECGTGTDIDGRTFIDYMYSPVTWGDTDFLTLHKNIIEDGVRTSYPYPSRLAKYYWMAWYHNRVINSKEFCDSEAGYALEMTERRALLIDMGLFGKDPKFPYDKIDDPFLFNWDLHQSQYHPDDCEWCADKESKGDD